MSEEDKSIETAKAAWRSQGLDERPLSIEYLRNRAFEQAKRSRSRSVIEYFLGCAAAVMCLWFAVVIDSVFFRVGVLIMLAGILYSLYEWWRRKMTWSMTLEGYASDSVAFYKQELVRLRDLHRGLWKIYLPASVPGAVLLLTWVFLERPETDNLRKVILVLAVAVWIVVTLRHEAQEAKRYQRELDALSKNG